MSSFENIQGEAKNVFLGLLIKLDFDTGKLVYAPHNEMMSDRPDIRQMHFVAGKIRNMVPKAEIEPIYDKIHSWVIGTSPDPMEAETIDTYQALCDILNSHFYYEMHLGVIPTSTLPTETIKPTREAINPNQTSRL